MKSSLPAIARKAATCLIAIAAAFFTASCSKKPAPEPFTGKLDNVEGAMVFYSFQHPKRITQGIDKLIAEIPEAAYARILLETYGAPYGYPEFSELAADADIGVYLPAQSLEQLQSAQKVTPIFFMKLSREDGKIWNAFVNGFGMRVRRHGEWALFAHSPDDAVFDTVKNPDAVIARLSTPQAENVRMWAALDGEMGATYQKLAIKSIGDAIAKSTLPDAEKKAFNAYAGVIFPEIFANLHSAGASLHFADTGLRINYGAQFKPDSQLGTLARYHSDATPVIGQYIANDSLLSATIRYVPKGSETFFDYVADTFLKVDYPPFAAPFAQLRKDYAGYWDQPDGCGAMTIDMEMDFADLKAPKSKAETFVANSGAFDGRITQRAMKATIGIAQQVITGFTNIAAQATDKKIPVITISAEDAAKNIAGHAFDAITVGVTGGDVVVPSQTTYYGVAGGNLISASSEAIIEKHLPSMLAKKTVSGNVAEANPLAPYDIASMTVNGGALVDLVCKTARVDLSDPDRQAVFAGIKERYKEAEPFRVTLEARQAAVTYKANIPYKFISASVKLAQYTYTYAPKGQKAK